MYDNYNEKKQIRIKRTRKKKWFLEFSIKELIKDKKYFHLLERSNNSD